MLRCKEKSVLAVGKRIIIILYLLWIPLTMAVALRLSSARMGRIYGETAGMLCVVAVLLVALWMAWGKVAAFARAGEIFYLTLSVLIAGIFLLAVFRVEWGSFFVEKNELAKLPAGSLASAGLILNVYPAVLLKGRIPVRGRNKKRQWLWAVVFCVAATLLLAAVTGCLGAKLTGQIAAPFYTVLQGLGVKGTFQRLEAPVAALLTLSDLTLTGLLLHAWRDMANQLCPGKWSRVAVVPIAAISLIGGMVLLADMADLWLFSSMVLPVIGLVLGFLCPLLVRIFAHIKRRQEQDRAHLVLHGENGAEDVAMRKKDEKKIQKSEKRC